MSHHFPHLQTSVSPRSPISSSVSPKFPYLDLHGARGLPIQVARCLESSKFQTSRCHHSPHSDLLCLVSSIIYISMQLEVFIFQSIISRLLFLVGSVLRNSNCMSPNFHHSDSDCKMSRKLQISDLQISKCHHSPQLDLPCLFSSIIQISS
jgi:hypothetical protein